MPLSNEELSSSAAGSDDGARRRAGASDDDREQPWRQSCGDRLVLGRTRQVAPAVDKLTLAQLCEELQIARSTFYDWRAKGRAPKCIKLPNGDLRVRRADLERWLAGLEEADS